ncbi:hypothetical protein M422DRAFT_245735 [Sphaerobolus stellatus SS14]|nr:hypothetical protein M422DRAFT_245735 [Sphaerobolus stellatus SS14]
MSTQPLLSIDPKDHWTISFSEKRNYTDIGNFLLENHGDPGVKGFYSCLQDHLLAHILGQNSNDDEINFAHDQHIFVDRDMLMRYMGDGIGHSIQYSTITSTGFEESDDTGEDLDTGSGQLPRPDTSRTELGIEEQLAADIIELNEEDCEEGVDEVEDEEEVEDEDEDGEGDEEAVGGIDDEAEDNDINEGYESP